jgi:hypothetical protein
MSHSPNYQAPGSLQMPIRYREPDASHYGASPHGVGHLVTATSRVLCAIRKMDHKHLAKVHMGEGGLVQDDGRNCTASGKSF